MREKECSRGGVWVCTCKPGLKKVLLALIRRSNLKMEYTVKSSSYTVYIFLSFSVPGAETWYNFFFHNNFPLIGNKNDREKLKMTGK